MNDNESAFVVDSPEKANWALEKIKEAEARTELYVESCKAKIEEIKLKIQNAEQELEDDTAYLRDLLKVYIKTVPAKKSKTSESLKLEGGTIRLKHAAAKLIYDESLIGKLAGTEYVELKPTLKWGEYKKILDVKDEMVIRTDTGEVAEGVAIEYTPERIEVE